MDAVVAKRRRVRPCESAAAFRSGYLIALDTLHIDPAQSARLAECLSGRPFESCGRGELEPVLERVRRLLYEHALDSSKRTADAPK